MPYSMLNESIDDEAWKQEIWNPDEELEDNIYYDLDDDDDVLDALGYDPSYDDDL